MRLVVWDTDDREPDDWALDSIHCTARESVGEEDNDSLSDAGTQPLPAPDSEDEPDLLTLPADLQVLDDSADPAWIPSSTAPETEDEFERLSFPPSSPLHPATESYPAPSSPTMDSDDEDHWAPTCHSDIVRDATRNSQSISSPTDSGENVDSAITSPDTTGDTSLGSHIAASEAISASNTVLFEDEVRAKAEQDELLLELENNANSDDELAALTQILEANSIVIDLSRPVACDRDEIGEITAQNVQLSPEQRPCKQRKLDHKEIFTEQSKETLSKNFDSRIRSLLQPIMDRIRDTKSTTSSDSDNVTDPIGSNLMQKLRKWDPLDLERTVLSLFDKDTKAILGVPHLTFKWLDEHLPDVGISDQNFGVYAIFSPAHNKIYVGCSRRLRERIRVHLRAIASASSPNDQHVHTVLRRFEEKDISVKKIFHHDTVPSEVLLLAETLMMVMLDSIPSSVDVRLDQGSLIAELIKTQQELGLQRSYIVERLNQTLSICNGVPALPVIDHPNPGRCEDCQHEKRTPVASGSHNRWLCYRCTNARRLALLPRDHPIFGSCTWCDRDAMRRASIPRMIDGKIHCLACTNYYRKHGHHNPTWLNRTLECACSNCSNIVCGPDRNVRVRRLLEGHWYCGFCWWQKLKDPSKEHLHIKHGPCQCEGCPVVISVNSNRDFWLREDVSGAWLCKWCFESGDGEHNHRTCVYAGCPCPEEKPFILHEPGPFCNRCHCFFISHDEGAVHDHSADYQLPCTCPRGKNGVPCPRFYTVRPNMPMPAGNCKQCRKFGYRCVGKPGKTHDHDALA